jgi:hypothetical protein
MPIPLWPKRSLTTFGWTPAISSIVAWLCRRSWNLIDDTFVFSSSGSQESGART